MSGPTARTNTSPRPSVAWHLAACAAIVALPSCMTASNDPALQPPTRPTETTSSGATPPPAVPVAARPTASASPLATHRASRIALTQLTQVQRFDSRAPTVNLRFDALDAAGNASRMAGELRVTLRAQGAEPEYLAFDVRIATEADQLRHFDETLRLYVVRLEPSFRRPPASGTSIEVASTLFANDGTTLESTGTFTW